LIHPNSVNWLLRFFEVRVKCLISDSGVGKQKREGSHNLESSCKISELIEKQRCSRQSINIERIADSASSNPPGVETR